MIFRVRVASFPSLQRFNPVGPGRIMPPSAQVIQWLDKNFPKPRVDPEWLEGCTQWLEEDQHISSVTNFVEFMERIKGQLLESDLLDSMQAGTGLDENVLTMSGHLRGPPVLVQIIAITDISSSAYQLEQIRSAREERLLAGEGNEEGEGDGDVEVEGEGPMPKYPRGTLRFQLSDGERTIQAIEYRQINEFCLGSTPLGYKIQLQGTKFQNGMAMLEPDTIVLLGGKQAELQAKQLEDFKLGLHTRLGHPLPQSEETINSFPTTIEERRSPLVDIPLPTAPRVQQSNDDIDLEPRRRVPTNSALNQISSQSNRNDTKEMRPIVGLPTRINATSPSLAKERNSSQSQGKRPMSVPERATLTQAGSRDMMDKSATSPYFSENAVASGSATKQSQNFGINAAIEELDFNLIPTHGQMTCLIPSPQHPSSESPSNSNNFNFDLFDEVDQENRVHSGKERQHGPEGTSTHKTLSSSNDDASSDDYGMDEDIDFDNPLFLKEFDVLERSGFQHQAKTSNAVTPSPQSVKEYKSSSSKPPTEESPGPKVPSPPKIPRQNAPSRIYVAPVDVIEIEDSDDEMENKENEAVPTRHVRRRTERSETAGPSQTSILQTQLSQKGRPIVLATNPDDIIELSDSD